MDKKLAAASIRKMQNKINRLKARIEQTTDETQKQGLTEKLYDALWNLGDAQAEMGDYKEAEKIFRLLPQKTHGSQRYYGLSRILIDKEKYDEAASVLEKAISKYPDDWNLLNSMGLIYYRTDRQHEALTYFDRALALENEDNSAILYNKALSLNLLGYYEEGFGILSALLDKASDEPAYILEMGYCCSMKGRPWDAIHYYRKAKELGCRKAAVYGGLCCAYADAGLKREAYMIAYEGVSCIPDDVRLYENCAQAALDLGLFEHAKMAIEGGNRIDPASERLKKIERDLDRQMGTKKFIEKPMNESLASDMNQEEKM